jgi:tight adherence protein B
VRRFLLVIALAAFAIAATPAWAAGGVTVRNVDTRGYPKVSLEVLVNGAAPKTTDFHLRENGAVIPDSAVEVRPLRQTAKPVGTVLVIDTSGSMSSRGAIDQAKAAARQFIAAKGSNDWIALVSFSSQALVRSDFTQDGTALTQAVDSLAAVGETALWDGLSTAAHLFTKRPDLQANLVLLSDGADTVSSANQQQAAAALTGAHTAVFAVGIASADFDPAGLSNLVGASGGSLSTSANPSDLSAQFSHIRAAIDNQYEVLYTSPGSGGPLSLDLTVAGQTTQVETRAGSVGASPAPRVVTASGGIFANPVVKYLLLALAALAAGILGFALLLIFGGREQSIDDRLGVYAGSGLDDSAAPAAQLAENNLIRRAVGLTSKMAERGNVLVKVEALLEQANLPLRAPEALFFYGAGAVLVGLMAIIGAPNIMVGLIAAAAVAAVPVVVLLQLRKRRLKAFEAQLPDTLNLLSGSLRAGYSFMQGVESVAQETSDPMARELRRVLAESRLGRPLEDAMEDVATRMHSRDFEWSVLAIRIQREVGGNLAELLQTVADTMTQRSRLKGEIKALTAEGRISGVVMGILPVALALFMLTVSPDYIKTLVSSFLGWTMVIGSVVMAVAGFAWIQKIIKIEV